MQRCIVSMGALAVLAVAGQAAPLYGVASYAPFAEQSLYQIDPATGLATLVGNTGLEEINGIAWNADANVLVAYTTDSELYALDLGTGAATFLADAVGIVPEGDLAYAGGTWYATNAALFGTVDPATAAFSAIGALGAAADDVSGLAVDGSGMVWGYAKNGSAADTLVTIDTGTGLATLVGPLGINSSSNVGGLALAPDTGTLYLTDHASLYMVDPVSGLATLIGEHGVTRMSGLAYVPEPAALGLLLIGLVAVRSRR